MTHAASGLAQASALTPSRLAAATGASLTFAGGAMYWAAMSSQSQLLGPFPQRGEPQEQERPCVALTFDDGPNEPYTSGLSELLARRGVQATFFQVGQAVAKFSETTAGLVAAGHVVGHHSYSHQMHRCLTAPSIEEEIRRTQDAFDRSIQRQPSLYRPPWLIRTPATFKVLTRHQLTAVSGTFCHPLEVVQCAAARIASRAVHRATNGRILIFHDGYNGQGADRTQTLDAVARVIDTLGEGGWSFTTVDALLGIPAYLPQ